MQLLSYVLTGISVILIIVMLVTYKKTRRMTSKTLWISIAITLVILIAYALFVGSSIPFWALILIGAVGAFFGLLGGSLPGSGRKMAECWPKTQDGFW